MKLSDAELIARGRNCLTIEADALQLTAKRLDERFVRVLRLLQKSVGERHKLVFTGVGKNVAIAQKVAGTFNSTGVPSAFLDPNQALHGDLGLCSEGDVAFFFSNSGETVDLVNLLPLVKRLGLKTVVVTAREGSALAGIADEVLLYTIDREACPLDLAPTASTTAALAIGDALAMVFLEMRNFTPEDFARYHPSGTLGKTLLLRARDIMRSGERFATAKVTVSVQAALLAMTEARCGTLAITDETTGKLVGVFSDGDFRRASLQDEYVLQRNVRDYITQNPRTVREDMLAADVLRVFEKTTVNDLLVVDAEGHAVGLIDGQDLPKLHIV